MFGGGTKIISQHLSAEADKEKSMLGGGLFGHNRKRPKRKKKDIRRRRERSEDGQCLIKRSDSQHLECNM